VKYAVVFERTPNNYSAYVPDLPGCIATGPSRDEVEQRIREAIAFHLEGLREQSESPPEPTAWPELVEA
jgi:predicted RNase H-like HicB family nuclease